MFENLDIVLEKAKTRVVYLYPVSGSPFYAEYCGSDNVGFKFKIGDGTRLVVRGGSSVQEQKYSEFYVNPNTVHRFRVAPERPTLEG
jgi:hypothetical protein